MPSFQQVIAIGHCTEPESRFTPSGKQVANFSVAVNDKRGGQEHTEWFRCVAWEKLAEVVTKYLNKGDPVMVVGRLVTRKWQDQDGQDKYSTDLVVNQIQLLGGKKGESAKQKPTEREDFEDQIPF